MALKPLVVQNYWNQEEEFIKAMHEKGIDFRDKTIADGTIHRFSVGKKSHKDGWYVFYGLAGAFGDLSRDIHEKARGFYGQDATPFEAWLKEEQGKMTWHIRNIEDCEMDKVLLLKKEGLSQRHIADETGLSPATINRRLKEAKGKGLFNESG